MPTYDKRTLANGDKRVKAIVRLKGYPHISKTFRLLEDAQKWAIQKEAEIIKGNLYPQDSHTFRQARDRYFNETLIQNPIKSEKDFRRHLNWWSDRIGHLKLSEIRPDIISKYKDELIKTGRSGGTTNRYLASLSSVLREASSEWNLIPHNPVQSVKYCKESKGRVRYLDMVEKEALLEEASKSQNHELYHLIDFALVTCARQGEILGLTWENIDLERYVVYIIDPKNGQSRNTVIPDRLVAFFKTQKRLNRKPFKNFPRKAFENVVKKANIKDFRFHDLRHTGISYIAMNGASDSELMSVGGWTNRNMIDTYAHLRPNFVESVITSKNPFY